MAFRHVSLHRQANRVGAAKAFTKPWLFQKMAGFLKSGQGYTGGGRFLRRLRNWRTSTGSPDGEILNDIDLLRERSRHLFKNNAVGRGAIRSMTSSVVGRGLKMQCAMEREVIARHNGWDVESSNAFFNEFETDVERRFRWWAESTECDIRGQMNFYDLTHLALNSTLQSGEVFVACHIKKHNNAPFRLRVNLIEADQVKSPLGAASDRCNRDGVKTTPYGEPVGYYINRNQEEWPQDIVYVPKYGRASGRLQILHLFRADRPGQTRGVPFLAPVIETLRVLGEYKKSELDAALVSSFFSVFIKSENPDALNGNAITGAGGQPSQSAEQIQEQGQDFNLAPAAIMQLMPGEDVTFANPTRPNSGYDAFATSLFREIGMALGIPYEMLIRHFSSSYSASRAARIEFEKEILMWREWLELRFCMPLYREWFIEEVLAGRIIAPGFFESLEVQAAYLASAWSGESMGQLDPVKEVEAAAMRVKYGFSTATEETVAISGGDYNRNITALQREKTLRKSAGIGTPLEWEPTILTGPDKRQIGEPMEGAVQSKRRNKALVKKIDVQSELFLDGSEK